MIDGEGGEGSDAALARAAAGGDRQAFAALYERHVVQVRRLVRARVRSSELAEEIAQEAFVRALERLDTLRRPERFLPWVAAIARNLVVARHRLEHRQGMSTDGIEAADDAVATDDLADLAELAALIGECLVDLSPRDATALTMVTDLELGPTEVAAALGLTTNAAKVVVHRARRRLRDALVREVLRRHPEIGCGTTHAPTCERCIAAARRRLADLVA